MRVLVTGATGYLGRAVVAALTAAGHEVAALTRGPGADLPTGVSERAGEITDPAAVRAAVGGGAGRSDVAGAEAVCHLAGLVRAREAARCPGRYYRVNLIGTLTVLDALVAATERSGVAGRLVFASTAAVYGTPGRQPIDEQAAAAPLNPYGATKLAAEQAVGWYAATGALGATVLRIFNAAGAAGGRGDEDPGRIIPRAVATAAGQLERLEVNGDGSAVRDFVHVADVADAFRRALEATEAGETRIYNVGATRASVRDIVAATERVTGRRVPVSHRPADPGEAPEIVADTRRIRRRLGWAPRRSGLDDLIADQWATVRPR